MRDGDGVGDTGSLRGDGRPQMSKIKCKNKWELEHWGLGLGLGE